MIYLDSCGIEPSRGLQLRVNVTIGRKSIHAHEGTVTRRYSHYHTPSALLRFEHEIKRKLSREFDETIISRFGDDQNGLDARMDASPA